MDQNTTNPVILLIEDEFYIQDIYRGVLSDSGYKVMLASDGNEGLEKALEKPNLILLDIMLPTTNGLEVLKKLKINPETKDIPVVLITNLGQPDIIQEAFENGAQGYLLKVRVDPKALVEQIRVFLADPKYKMDFNKITFD